MKRYFIESTHDDKPGALQAIGIKPAAWQYFLTGSGMVGGINSILVGVFTGPNGEGAFNDWIFNAWGNKYEELKKADQTPPQLEEVLKMPRFFMM